MNTPVIIVHLRRPRAGDRRTDPLYEFGSFGLTGCHQSNLLADQAAAGARLAFAQGGDLGFRLVMLTPPIDVRPLAHVREARWKPADMPLRYDVAPVLIDNDGSSDLDGMHEVLAGVNRNTWREKFSSSFRSRTRPLDPAIAAAVVRAWDRALETGAARAGSYWEALPYWQDEVVDRDRPGTYDRLLRAARGEAPRGDSDSDGDGDRDGDDDGDDPNAVTVPAGVSCRPRTARAERKPGPKPPHRC
ncbi:MAG: hypothetical protein HS111_04610 [Kofleriaceae bacterium]|nr:hypothetical protein [Kofleriaceae bacterium]MCL4228381.1 hypothetical protein [Myxococcales bacterium]